ncbi:hypothetical protein FKM82_011288 [Ascaphus truei]
MHHKWYFYLLYKVFSKETARQQQFRCVKIQRRIAVAGLKLQYEASNLMIHGSHQSPAYQITGSTDLNTPRKERYCGMCRDHPIRLYYRMWTLVKSNTYGQHYYSLHPK